MKEFFVRDRYNRDVIARAKGETFGAAVSAMVRNGEDLSYGDFSGASLRGAELSGGCFYMADWRAADLTKASLCQAELASGQFYRTIMVGADAQGADLSFALLNYTDMRNVDLRGASVRDCKVIRLRLDGAKLDGADFNGSFLEPRTVIKAGRALDRAILGPLTACRTKDIAERITRHRNFDPKYGGFPQI